ncbi:MAG: hypothetical protein ACTSRZ_04535 [Promethearchaeota archaeon]
MVNESIILIFFGLLILIFVLLIIYANKYVQKQEKILEERRLEEKVSKVAKKIFKEEDIEKKKEEFKKIESLKQKLSGDIMEKAEARSSKMQKVMKKKLVEQKIIEQAGKLYMSFSIGLKSAMPRNEAERQRDMQELISTMRTLETFDAEYYKKQKKEARVKTDLGRGMFLDRIATKLNSYMRKMGLKKQPFFVFDKLISFGLENIKNISRKDLLEVLPYLKEAAYIKDYIEINPQLYIINQTGKKIELSYGEKVLINFAYEIDDLTLDILAEKAQWPKEHAENILNKLIEKGLIEIENGIIKLVGSETKEEKQKRLKIEEKIEKLIIQKEIEKEKQRQIIEEKFKEEKKAEDELTLKKIAGEKEIEAEEKEIAQERIEQEIKAETIKMKEKPQIKTLPIPTAKPSVTSKIIEPSKIPEQEIPHPATEVELNPDEIVGVDEELKEKIVAASKQSKDVQISDLDAEPADKTTSLQNETDILDELSKLAEKIQEKEQTSQTDFSEDADLADLNFDDIIGKEFVEAKSTDELNKEAIIEGILSIYERYEHLNGGLMDLKFIHKLLVELYPNITIQNIAQVKDQLLEMGFLRQTLEYENNQIWIFKDMELDDDMKSIIEILTQNGPQSKEQLCSKLGWNEERVLTTLKKLQNIDVLNLDKENKAFLPGVLFEG